MRLPLDLHTEAKTNGTPVLLERACRGNLASEQDAVDTWILCVKVRESS